MLSTLGGAIVWRLVVMLAFLKIDVEVCFAFTALYVVVLIGVHGCVVALVHPSKPNTMQP